MNRFRTATFAILAIAACLRLHNIDFGLPALNDPDELMFQMGAIRMLRGGTLNPGWFGHPATTTMYVLALADILVFAWGFITGRFATPDDFASAVFADPTWVILPGRVIMALFGVATVWLTMRLAREVSGKDTALTSGLVMATTPLAVGWAQVIRSDIMATAFMLACLIAASRYWRRPSGALLAWAALWLALSVATKWPFALGALAMLACILDRWRARVLTLRGSLMHIAAFAALAIALLLIVSPYLLLAHETLVRNLQGEAQAHHLGATGGTPLQNLAWYAQGPLMTALGWPGAVLAATGLLLMARSPVASRVLLPVAIGFAVVLVSQHLVWDRWALPLLPILAIGIGTASSALSTNLRRFGERAKYAVLAAIAALVAGPLAAAAYDEGVARAHDTRQAATAWARTHIPAGSTVLIEQFSFDLQDAPWQILFPMGDAGCVDAKAMLAGKIDYATIEAARGTRSIVDYGTVAPARAGSCDADYAIIVQYDRYAAERADFPREYEAYRNLVQRGTERAVFRAQGENATGPTVRIIAF